MTIKSRLLIIAHTIWESLKYPWVHSRIDIVGGKAYITRRKR